MQKQGNENRLAIIGIDPRRPLFLLRNGGWGGSARLAKDSGDTVPRKRKEGTDQ